MQKLFTISSAILFILSVFLPFQLVNAQSPEKMSYQAVLRNSDGNLIVNSSVGVRIQILQTSEFGAAVFVETHSTTTNVNGLVTLEIGSGTVVLGTLAGINWANGPYFIKTETDPTGGTSYTVTGTSQLLSVPYALHAKSAENVFSGNYNDLTNRPALFNGNYNDLSNLPTLFDGSWAEITGKPKTLAGYGIVDGMNTSHDANVIDLDMIKSWTTANDWGDHANAGYAILPTQTDNNGKYLKTNGTSAVWDTIKITETGIQNPFQFVTYKPGTPNPIAFGSIRADGTIASGTGNFTCTWSLSGGGRYEITITGESYIYSSYTTIVQITSKDLPIARVNSANSNLLVYLIKQSF